MGQFMKSRPHSSLARSQCDLAPPAPLHGRNATMHPQEPPLNLLDYWEVLNTFNRKALFKGFSSSHALMVACSH